MDARRLNPTLALTLATALWVGGCADSPTTYVPPEPLPPSGPEPDPDPNAWPPVIAFVSTRDGSPHIYVSTAEGSGVRKLFPGEDPAWSWDGQWIAFTREGSSTNPPGVYVMDRNGDNLRHVVWGGANPAWTPDGRIVFNSGSSIHIINADGSGERLLVRPDFAPRPVEPGYWLNDVLYEPALSPDGSKLAFRRSSHSGSGTTSGTYPYYDDLGYSVVHSVFVAKADGSDPREVAFAWGTEGLSWSPNGTAVAGIVNSTRVIIYNVTTGAIDPVRLELSDQWGAHGRPDWSPDGSELLFEAWNFSYLGVPPFGVTPRRIFAASVETGRVRRVIRDAVSPRLATYEDYAPVWSRAAP
jgi:Tol biopolymer transport system component